MKKFFIIFLVIIFIAISPFFFVKIQLIGDSNIILDYNEKYSESGYKATLFNKNITSDIKVISNIENAIGEYEIEYSYDFFIYNISKIRKVSVKDLSSPVIKLESDDFYELTIDTEYNEPGYIAYDNLDGDLTNVVTVENNINVHELGEYEVIYKVADSSNNESTIKRKVKVEKKKPTQMSVEEYSLDGWYEETILDETDNIGDLYFNQLKLVGDSNTMNMYLNGILDADNAWAIPCLHSSDMYNKEINLYGLGIKMNLIDAVKKYQPNYLYINFGTFSTTWISEDIFLKYANLVIEDIKKFSPNTNIVLISILPILKGDNINKFRQETINRYNFYILELANKHNIHFLNVQEALKGEDGYAKEEYFFDDKFHLTYSGHLKVKEYINTHVLIKE